MRLELHCHTKYSNDSLQSFHLLYWKCRVKKIKYIAITDHNNLAGAIAFEQFCKKRGSKVHVIKGEEVLTTEGEIIGLYLKKEIPEGLSPEATIEQIIDQDGVVYIPHPYDEKRNRTVLDEDAIDRNVDKIDCIECHNGRNVFQRFDVKQSEIAQKYGLRKIIGSDAHTSLEIGRNYIDVNVEPVDRSSFLKAIEKPTFHKKKCMKFAHQITKIERLINMLKKGKINEICRIFNKRIRE